MPQVLGATALEPWALLEPGNRRPPTPLASRCRRKTVGSPDPRLTSCRRSRPALRVSHRPRSPPVRLPLALGPQALERWPRECFRSPRGAGTLVVRRPGRSPAELVDRERPAPRQGSKETAQPPAQPACQQAVRSAEARWTRAAAPPQAVDRGKKTETASAGAVRRPAGSQRARRAVLHSGQAPHRPCLGRFPPGATSDPTTSQGSGPPETSVRAPRPCHAPRPTRLR